MNNQEFSQAVLGWFDHSGRKHLPWQHQRTAYRVWISEIMLQQTQVATVIPYFERFMQRFPTIHDLANASQEEVLHLWTGLGYYARGRNLHKCAHEIIEKYSGDFPDDPVLLSELPGIGKSTAGAIVSIAYNKRATILDGNVKRVLARFHGISDWPGKTSVANKLWLYAENYTPHQRYADYSQAMMDFGATLCTRSQPKCDSCPLRKDCIAGQSGNPQDFPGKKPRTCLPAKNTQMLILTDKENGSVFLQLRPPQGIWGGLWSLPELEQSDDALSYSRQHFGKVVHFDNWDSFRHTFSHYRLDIQPISIVVERINNHINENEKKGWFSHQQVTQLGLSAPVKRLLTTLSTKTKPNLLKYDR